MGDKNPLASSGKTLRVTESPTLPPIAARLPGRTSTTRSQWPAPRLRLSRVVPLPLREEQIRSPTCGARSSSRARDQGGARPARPLDQALDIDRVGWAGAEEVARHAGALDVPGDEGGRPRHVVEPAALGMADACPVVLDALRRLALLDAELLGARRAVGRVGDDLLAEARPFADRQQHHRGLGAGGGRRRLGLPRRGRAGAERRQPGRALDRGLGRRRAARGEKNKNEDDATHRQAHQRPTPPITRVGTPSVWFLHREDLAARSPAVARFRHVEAGRLEARVRPGDVGRAPAQAPQVIGPVRHALLEVVRDLDHEIAAAEEQQPRAPGRVAAVEPQIEAQPSGVKCDGALGIGRAHDDVIERADRRRFVRAGKRRGQGAVLAFAEVDRHAVRRGARQDEAVASAFARHGAPLEQARGLVEIAGREHHR